MVNFATTSSNTSMKAIKLIICLLITPFAFSQEELIETMYNQTADASGVFVIRQAASDSGYAAQLFQLDASNATALVMAEQSPLRGHGEHAQAQAQHVPRQARGLLMQS